MPGFTGYPGRRQPRETRVSRCPSPVNARFHGVPGPAGGRSGGADVNCCGTSCYSGAVWPDEPLDLVGARVVAWWGRLLRGRHAVDADVLWWILVSHDGLSAPVSDGAYPSVSHCDYAAGELASSTVRTKDGTSWGTVEVRIPTSAPQCGRGSSPAGRLLMPGMLRSPSISLADPVERTR